MSRGVPGKASVEESIVLAVLYAYLWFKDEPSPAVWYGLPLVIGSGLYILYRERVRAREHGLAALT